MSAYDILNILREYMSDTKILEELMHAQSEQEARENLEHIADMWGIELM